MTEKKPDDTRRMLKLFGVAVTDFESESAELLGRIEGGAGDERAAALRDLLELIAETNGKWQSVTDHIFERQRRALADVVRALARSGS